MSFTNTGRRWIALGALATMSRGTPAARAEIVDFARDIQPVLSDKCYVCHGPGQQMAGLRMDRKDSASRVLVGQGESKLLRRITSKDPRVRMPPWEPVLSLSQAEISLFKSWVEQGAKWPESKVISPALERVVEAIERRDQTALRKLLMDRGLVNARDEQGATPLMHAALNGDIRSVELLLNRGADPNLQNAAGATALMWAVEDVAKVRLLLARGAKANVRSREGTTALIAAALFRGSEAVLGALLDHGADPNLANTDGSTALVQAATVGDLASMRLLIRRGAQVDSKAVGASPQIAGLVPLTAAAYYGQLEAVRLLLENGANVDAYDGVGGTALLMAVVWDDKPMVELLMKMGADVNRPTRPSNPFATDPGTPVMLAAYTESLDPGMTKMLIAKGARVNTGSRDGETALMRARGKGNSAVVDALLEAGARDVPFAEQRPVVKRREGLPDIRTAVEKSLSLLQATDQEFLRKSGCKSCHSQSLPEMAVTLARQRGFRVNESLARRQPAAVLAAMDTQREKALQMMDPDGGAPLGASYALIALDGPPNATTDAFARNIAARQLPDGQWRPPGFRAPMEYGEISPTALAMRALQLYSPASRKQQYQGQIGMAVRWLRRVQPRFTEERVFQLLGLAWGKADLEVRRKRAHELLKEQRADGGWGQLASLPSDAYATGQALYALQNSASVRGSDAAYQRGVRFLLETQANDGSWFVKSRAVSFQPHFEAGFPYGKDQFISAAGTSWAAMALMLGTPETR